MRDCILLLTPRDAFPDNFAPITAEPCRHLRNALAASGDWVLEALPGTALAALPVAPCQ